MEIDKGFVWGLEGNDTFFEYILEDIIDEALEHNYFSLFYMHYQRWVE